MLGAEQDAGEFAFMTISVAHVFAAGQRRDTVSTSVDTIACATAPWMITL
jgi:hypothetical protein